MCVNSKMEKMLADTRAIQVFEETTQCGRDVAGGGKIGVGRWALVRFRNTVNTVMYVLNLRCGCFWYACCQEFTLRNSLMVNSRARRVISKTSIVHYTQVYIGNALSKRNSNFRLNNLSSCGSVS